MRLLEKFHTDIRGTEVPAPNTIPRRRVSRARAIVARDTGFNLPEGWDYSWVSQRKPYQGTFPKRVRQYMHKRHDLKISPSDLERMGNDLSALIPAPTQRFMRFTQDFSWERGMFGDGDSCFWSNHGGARPMLERAGAWAVQFFSQQQPGDWHDGTWTGTGRAWILPYENVPVIFNGYGFNNGASEVANILAPYFHEEVRNVELMNRGEPKGTLWINSSNGYAIGSTEELDRLPDCVDPKLPELHRYCCEMCDGPRIYLSHEDIVYDINAELGKNGLYYFRGTYYCRGCKPSLARCRTCDRTTPVSELRYVTDWWMCQDCIVSRGYSPSTSNNLEHDAEAVRDIVAEVRF